VLARLVRTIVVATVVAGFVAGCAAPPPKPDTMRDPSVNFSNFKTFGWTAGDTIDAGDASSVICSAATTERAISSCTAKMSSICRS
jgi:hypothetical protein